MRKVKFTFSFYIYLRIKVKKWNGDSRNKGRIRFCVILFSCAPHKSSVRQVDARLALRNECNDPERN